MIDPSTVPADSAATPHRWGSPIPGGSPSGADVTYDPRFEQISAEIDKLSSVSGGKPDWRLVEENGEALVTTAAKDLRVAAWATLAKTHVRGWAGLVDGLEGTAAIVSAHWDGMNPPTKRMRARANVVDWLWTQLPIVIATLPASLNDAPICDRVDAVLGSLASELDAKLGELSPSSRDLRNAVSERQRAMQRPAPPAAVAAESAPATSSNGAPSTSSNAGSSFSAANIEMPVAESADSLDGAMDVARKWTEMLFTLARQARRVAPSSGWPYRLARTAAWLTVESLPEVEEADKTYIRGPRPNDQRELTDMLNAGNWEGLVDGSEAALGEHALWLDLHRFSATALDRLGHAEARAAVGRESAALVRRFPRLLDLKFSGGSPLASPETRTWFEQEMAAWGGGGGPTPGTKKAVDVGELLDAARVRVGSGDIAGGVAQALKGANEQPTSRLRFGAKAQVAELALGAGDAAFAKAISEELLDEIGPGPSAISIDAWAPEEVGLCYQVYIRAERSLANSDDRSPDDRVQSLLKRLLQVDPETALKLWR